MGGPRRDRAFTFREHGTAPVVQMWWGVASPIRVEWGSGGGVHSAHGYALASSTTPPQISAIAASFCAPSGSPNTVHPISAIAT